MVFIQEHYGKQYAENTRETIRRQTLHQFEHAGLAVRNPDNPSRPTNSPNNVYMVSNEALEAIRKFGAPEWNGTLQSYLKAKGRLVELYEKRKKSFFSHVEVSDGTDIYLAPGKHNELQEKILREFRKRFCPKTKVIYVGDAANKMLYRDEALLAELNIPITLHDKLPDVLLYDESGKVLFLIEAVTSHGPLSPKRQIELEKILENCKAGRVYISAFLDLKQFKKHIDNIAWETEVWIENKADHMIHFNGPKFMSIYDR